MWRFGGGIVLGILGSDLRWISIDDTAQYLIGCGTLQTFRSVGAFIVDPFAVVANAMGGIVQTITIARI